MYKDKQTIHYCTILSAGQWDFLLEGKFSALRQKCLHRLMSDAVRTKTTYKIKGIEIVLGVRSQLPTWNWRNTWAATVKLSANSLTALTASVC